MPLTAQAVSGFLCTESISPRQLATKDLRERKFNFLECLHGKFIDV